MLDWRLVEDFNGLCTLLAWLLMPLLGHMLVETWGLVVFGCNVVVLVEFVPGSWVSDPLWLSLPCLTDFLSHLSELQFINILAFVLCGRFLAQPLKYLRLVCRHKTLDIRHCFSDTVHDVLDRVVFQRRDFVMIVVSYHDVRWLLVRKGFNIDDFAICYFVFKF